MNYLDVAKAVQQRLRAERGDTMSPPGPRAAEAGAPPELRQAYRQWFTLTVGEANGRRVSPAEAQALYQQIVRLTDDIGPVFADAILADEARRFRAATHRCGLCGGPPHA